MPGRNADLVHRAYDALNRRDLHALLQLVDPDVVATSRVLDAEGALYRGREGMRALIEDILSVFPDWAPEVEEVRELGDSAVARIRMRGRAVGSGLALDEVGWQALRFREGRLVLMRGFGTEAEAVAALRRHERAADA